LLLSTTTRQHFVNLELFPKAQSITITGNHVDFGGGYFTETTITTNVNISFQSDMIFDNIRFLSNDQDTFDLNINSFSLTLTGYHNFFGPFLRIVGSVGSTINNLVSYQTECYADVEIETMNLISVFVIRGNTNHIINLNNNSINGYFRLVSGVNELTIDNIYLNAYNVEVINIQNAISPIIHIGNIYETISSGDYRRIFVRIFDVSEMPVIEISGEVNLKLEYLFYDTTYSVFTDINGVDLEWLKHVADFSLFGDQTVLTAVNLPFDQFRFRLVSSDITGLFEKNEDGEFYRNKDFKEIIIDGVLVSVLSLNNNPMNTYIIPDTVQVIGPNAFQGYFNLTEIIIPNTVVEIQEYAFNNIERVNHIIIPESVTLIKDYGFIGFTGIIFFEALAMLETFESMWNSSKESVIFGFDGQIHDNGTFIYTITLHQTVTILGLSEENSNPHIVIPETIDGYPVTQFIKQVFRYNEEILTITISSNIISIPDYAFAQCTQLNNVIILENTSIEYIGDFAFSHTALIEFTIPETVTYVGMYAFFGNVDLMIYVYSLAQTSTWSDLWIYSIGMSINQVTYLN
jgi:hypothetical protein